MYKNTITEVPQVSTVVQVTTAVPSVSVNIFIGKLQDIFGFTNTHVWGLVDYGYDNQESVLYYKFIYIEEWCQLKSIFPVKCVGVYLMDIGR